MVWSLSNPSCFPSSLSLYFCLFLCLPPSAESELNPSIGRGVCGSLFLHAQLLACQVAKGLSAVPNKTCALFCPSQNIPSLEKLKHFCFKPLYCGLIHILISGSYHHKPPYQFYKGNRMQFLSFLLFAASIRPTIIAIYYSKICVQHVQFLFFLDLDIWSCYICYAHPLWQWMIQAFFPFFAS